jgi:hypothetical protein
VSARCGRSMAVFDFAENRCTLATRSQSPSGNISEDYKVFGA